MSCGADSPPQPVPGQRLSGPGSAAQVYTLLLKLGDGAFGQVYRAVDEDGGEWAVKVMWSTAEMDAPCLADLFAHEIAMLRSARDLKCPYLVRLKGSFIDDATKWYCIVMELAHCSLEFRMGASAVPYSIDEVVKWAMQLAMALQALEGATPPIVHADLSLSNILLSKAGDLILTDFGIAMWASRRRITTINVFQPESPYVATEILSMLVQLKKHFRDQIFDRLHEHIVDGKYDMWSYGVCVYLLATRRPPSSLKIRHVNAMSKKSVEVLVWELEQEMGAAWQAQAPSDTNLRQMAALASVIARALNRTPGLRLSAKEALEALQASTSPSLVEIKRRYQEHLCRLLQSRPDMFGEEGSSISYDKADLVELQMLKNEDWLKELEYERTKGVKRKRQEEDEEDEEDEDSRGGSHKGLGAALVSWDAVLQGSVCSKGLSFIVGPPGSGKSTLLQHLALHMAQEQTEEVPILVHAYNLSRELAKARDLHNPAAAVEVLVASIAMDVKDGKMTEELRRLGNHPDVHGQRLTLLIDSLDEIADRVPLLEQVINLCSVGDSGLIRRIIICSRPGAFEGLSAYRHRLEAVLRIRPLNGTASAEMAEKLVRRWGVVDEVLIKKAMDASRRRFVGSPLLVYLMCRLVKSQNDVPADVVELYQRVVEDLLQRALRVKQQHGAESGNGGFVWTVEKARQMCYLVGYLVHALGFRSRSEVVEMTAVKALLQKVLQGDAGRTWRESVLGNGVDAEVILNDALEGFSGLLVPQGRTGYCMLHRTIQEYTAACFLATDGEEDVLLGRLRDAVVLGLGKGRDQSLDSFSWSNKVMMRADWWMEVYRFAGLMRGPEWMAEQVLGTDGEGVRQWLARVTETSLDREDLGHFRLRHTVRACCGGHELDGTFIQLVGGTLASMVTQHAAIFLRFTSRFIRSQDWAQIHPDVTQLICQTSLVTLASDSDSLMMGIRVVSKLGEAAARHPGVMEKLVSCLRDAEAHVRHSAAEALGKLGEATARHPGLMDELVDLLSDTKGDLWRSAAWALGRLGEAVARHPGVMEKLLSLLRDANLRRNAAEALGNLGEAAARHPGVVEGLVELLSDAGENVRESAAMALGHLGEAAARHPGVMEGLLNLLSDNHMNARQNAVYALGELGEAAARHPGVIDGLLDRLRDKYGLVQWSASLALAKLGEAAIRYPGMMEKIVYMLGDPDKRFRNSAADSLGVLGEAAARHPGVIEKLLNLLRDDADIQVRCSAALALGRLGEAAVTHPGVLEKLSNLLRDANSRLRRRAAIAFGNLGEAAGRHTGVVEGLVQLLGDADLSVRICATEALGRLGEAAARHPNVMEGLVEQLSDVNLHLRQNAAHALDKLGRHT